MKPGNAIEDSGDVVDGFRGNKKDSLLIIELFVHFANRIRKEHLLIIFFQTTKKKVINIKKKKRKRRRRKIKDVSVYCISWQCFCREICL
jgi:hypothetical protein